MSDLLSTYTLFSKHLQQCFCGDESGAGEDVNCDHNAGHDPNKPSIVYLQNPHAFINFFNFGADLLYVTRLPVSIEPALQLFSIFLD